MPPSAARVDEHDQAPRLLRALPQSPQEKKKAKGGTSRTTEIEREIEIETNNAVHRCRKLGLGRTVTLEPNHHQTFDPFRARATNETCLLLTASPQLQIQHRFPRQTLTSLSHPKMSSMDSSADDREGLLDVLRNTLRFLSCSSYREPTHSYMELEADEDEAQPGRPELPRRATYCSLPRGIRRMSAPTTEDHNEDHENTDSR